MKIDPDDRNLVVGRLPADVAILIRDHRLILAGGFIRSNIAGEEPTDLDLFGSSADGMNAAADALIAIRGGEEKARKIVTENAITVVTDGRTAVQFITRWTFDGAESLLAHFDFTVARAAIWCDAEDEWDSECDPRFYVDLAARRLTYTRPDEPEAGASLLRMVKMLRRGYSIHAPSLAWLVAAVAKQGKPDMINDLEALTVGVFLTLREVDPSVVMGARP